MTNKPTISKENLMRIFSITDDRTFNDYVKRGFFKQIVLTNNILYDVDDICKRLKIDTIDEPLLTTEEVAEILGVDNKSVIVKANKGILPCYKFQSGRKRRLYFLRRQIEEHKKLRVEFRYDIVNRCHKLTFYQAIMLTLLDTKPFSSNLTPTEADIMRDYFIDNETMKNIGKKYTFSKQCASEVIETASNKLLNNIIKVKEKLNSK